jgi:hypothetical protein
MAMSVRFFTALSIVALCACTSVPPDDDTEKGSGASGAAGGSGGGGGGGASDPLAIRVGHFNIKEFSTAKLLDGSDQQASAAAEVIARHAADIVCINEIQYDMVNTPSQGMPGAPFAQPGGFDGGAENATRLADRVRGFDAAVDYTDRLITRGNSGFYWNGDDLGQSWYILRGWGEFAGRFNTAVLSRYPILRDQVRVITDVPWESLPENTIAQMERDLGFGVPPGFPIFEKSLNIVPVDLGEHGILYLVLLHTVSPAFDPINPYRNYDELRALRMFLDAELPGVEPLPEGARFMVIGDLNADPDDGDGLPGAIQQVLEHPSVVAWFPEGHGTKGDNGQYNTYLSGCGNDDGVVVNPTQKFQMQLDYILPSQNIGEPSAGAIFWPDFMAEQDDFALRCYASDHSYMFADVTIAAP